MSHITMIRRFSIVVLWLIVWQLVSWAIDRPFLLCGPIEVAEFVCGHIATPPFWIAIANSLARIMAGFIVAMFLGLALGGIAARWKIFAEVLSPPINVIKSAPVVCFIALILIWVGSGATTSIIAGLVTFPPFYFAMDEIHRSRDIATIELLDAYSVAGWKRALCVNLAHAAPYLKVAIKTSVGMAWKAGIAAELIGLASASIGEKIYLGKLSLDSSAIISWTAMVIFLSWLCEKSVIAVFRACLHLPRLMLDSTVKKAMAPDADDSSLDGGASSQEKHDFDEGLVKDLAESLDEGSGDCPEKPTGIVVKSLTKQFGQEMVFNSFDIDFAAGSRTCIMAPSGSGKTTLIRIIAGLDDRFEGNVNPCGPTETAIVFQDSRLFDDYTVAENLALTSSTTRELACSIQIIHDLFPDDGSILNKKALELSGGMRRRVELARALAHRSATVFLDEPFAGLDAASKGRCAIVIDKALGARTLIVATHDIDDAPMLKADIALL